MKNLFELSIEFKVLKSVLGSGYESKVADLALRDKIAYRAARKNMQIHSCVILEIDGNFGGFFTFQINHEAKEFCLLQSAMENEFKDKDLYKKMVEEIINHNTFGYPMLMTVSTKHELENPKLFESLGFQIYLKTGTDGFAYMVYGTMEQIRMKRICHTTMTNIWYSYKGDRLKMKRERNVKIEEAGEKHRIEDPKFASRRGCRQGSAGFSNVLLSKNVVKDGKVKTNSSKSLNGNASVLDPMSCEAIIRFFMPTCGDSIYNPFGGGVQMGFVAGSYGYKYLASEIRKNQCDVNNKLCSDFENVKWHQSDSTTYKTSGKYDLAFACPPYYGIEKYVDYDGNVVDGDLDHLGTYEEFRTMLFKGYKNAIENLKDDRFFVIIVGDSRGKDGSYLGAEADHEIFFREQGLHLYNKINYLESEFTRRAQAKRTLDFRKFPKAEQKIMVFYKGDMKKIKDNFPAIGRL